MEHSRTYKTKMAIYGQELMKPTIQEFLSQIASFPGWNLPVISVGSQKGPVSGMQRIWEKVRLAPLEPDKVSEEAIKYV